MFSYISSERNTGQLQISRAAIKQVLLRIMECLPHLAVEHDCTIERE